MHQWSVPSFRPPTPQWLNLGDAELSPLSIWDDSFRFSKETSLSPLGFAMTSIAKPFIDSFAMSLLTSTRTKTLLQTFGVFDFVKTISDARKRKQWERAGRPVPPPHAVKADLLRDLQSRYGLAELVETGAFKGDMLYTLRNDFEALQSIELSPQYYREASNRLRGFPQITIHLGDSAEQIGLVLGRLTRPALFWLDGHYSGAGTARAVEDTPIMTEVARIFDDTRFHHVVAIDDAHEFVGENDYPTMDEFRDHLATVAPDHEFHLENNVIALAPPPKA